MNLPTLTVSPASITGYSLLKWQDGDGLPGLRSVQMPTLIASGIVRAIEDNKTMKRTLSAYVVTLRQTVLIGPAIDDTRDKTLLTCLVSADDDAAANELAEKVKANYIEDFSDDDGESYDDESILHETTPLCTYLGNLSHAGYTLLGETES